jgi:pSer/pThr/pTyr-binding forkhead associated (FHA) protein
MSNRMILSGWKLLSKASDMPKLEVRKSGVLVNTINTQSESVTIGRMLSCDVAIDDLDVALRQIEISKLDNGYTAEPLSLNMSLSLNGNPIKGRRPISDGDYLEIGRYSVKFFKDADPDDIISKTDDAEDSKSAERLERDSSGIDALLAMPGVTIESDDAHDPIVAADSPDARWEPPVRKFQSADELAERIARGDVSSMPDRASLYLFGLIGPQEGRLIELAVGTSTLKCSSTGEVSLQQVQKRQSGQVAVEVKSADEAYLVGGRKPSIRRNGKSVSDGSRAALEISDEILLETRAGYSIFRIAGQGRVDVSPPTHYVPLDSHEKPDRRAWIAPFAVVVILLLITLILLFSR